MVQTELILIGKLDMVQNCSNHLYKFGAALPYKIADSLRKSDSDHTRICKAEFAEIEPCRKLEFFLLTIDGE